MTSVAIYRGLLAAQNANVPDVTFLDAMVDDEHEIKFLSREWSNKLK